MRILCFSLLLLTGCTQVAMHAPQRVEKKLIDALRGLESHAPAQEYSRLAHDIVTRTATLNRAFGRTTPPKFHNFLVIMGIKKQGLCYHYSDGLYRYLKARENHYPHFGFHEIGANIGSYWREHNALAVTRKGSSVKRGIVVDAWRNTGRLFVAPIKDDERYRWVHRIDRGCP